MKLIASGRTADVYALDSGRVLRRYRSGDTALVEAKVMAYVRAQGFPVPAVHDATQTDLVMDHLPGPTMLEALTRRPWLLFRYGRQLGELHDRLHEIQAPQWLPSFCEGDRILHLDLHPGNVILTPSGPSVIDWCNARAGAPAADVATTMILLSSADAPNLITRLGRTLLLRAFLGASRTDPQPQLRAVASGRLQDPNTTPTEQVRLRRFVSG